MKNIAMLLIAAVALAFGQDAPTLSPSLETQVAYEDIADAAVWESPENPEQNLLIAALEGDGITVFNAEGAELDRNAEVEPTAVDIRYAISSDAGALDILAFTLPEEDAIAFYSISAEDAVDLGSIRTGITAEVLCLHRNTTTGEFYATGADDKGVVEQYKLSIADGSVSSVLSDEDGNAKPVRRFEVGGEISACIVDDYSATLYLAEQNVGVWSYGASPENVKDRSLVDVVQPLGRLTEIEGLDLVQNADGNGQLIVADENEAGYFAYDLASHDFIDFFMVEGIEEGKALATSSQGIWFADTEADAPVYAFVASSSLTDVLGENDYVANRDLSAGELSLVPVSGETQAVDDDGDAADDTAFWRHPEDASQSLIIATNKQGGLMAYNLQGEELQYLNEGEPNNVDIRYVTTAEGTSIALAGASNRADNTIAFYQIDAGDMPITVFPVVGDSAHADVPEIASELNEVYGFCMYQNDDATYAFVNGKSGQVEQWRLEVADTSLEATLVRTFSVPSQPEGCVADDEAGMLYLGEENVGIWRFEAAEDASNEGELIEEISAGRMVADVEGLTIFADGTDKYLIASSQGNNSYAVYDLNNTMNFVGSFALIGDDSKGLDGSSDTDGIDVIAGDFGADYPAGIFIAQDWYNINADYEVENQNFKLASWQAIMEALQQ